jgi:ribosomal protein S18 acetylase RimI-like enzyme
MSLEGQQRRPSASRRRRRTAGGIAGAGRASSHARALRVCSIVRADPAAAPRELAPSCRSGSVSAAGRRAGGHGWSPHHRLRSLDGVWVLKRAGISRPERPPRDVGCQNSDQPREFGLSAGVNIVLAPHTRPRRGRVAGGGCAPSVVSTRGLPRQGPGGANRGCSKWKPTRVPEASAWTPHAVQLQQVWVDAEVRNRGYAKRGMRDPCRLLLERVPRVCLFVRRENAPAIRSATGAPAGHEAARGLQVREHRDDEQTP